MKKIIKIRERSLIILRSIQLLIQLLKGYTNLLLEIKEEIIIIILHPGFQIQLLEKRRVTTVQKLVENPESGFPL